MAPVGSLEFTIEDLQSELRIRCLGHAGWIERVVAPAMVAPLVAAGWFWRQPALIVAASGLVMLLIIRWAWRHPSTLRVLPDRLITSVYLWNETETALSDIDTVQWLPGEPLAEAGDPAGLYVSCGGRRKCVLPLVSAEQAKAAMAAIAKKFPSYAVGVRIPGSADFGPLPDMTAFTLPSSTQLDSNDKG